jgi:hypothetical protein
MDEEFRRSLGEVGKQASRSREMNYLGRVWLEIISQAANVQKINAAYLVPEQ